MTDAAQAQTLVETRSTTLDFRSLLSAALLRRAAVVALGLGSILTIANQADAVFAGGKLQLLPLVLVYATPFAVVTVSQVSGIRQAVLDARRGLRANLAEEPFFSTVLSHGIPLKALRLALLVGCLNGSLVATAALVQQGDLSGVSWPLLGQAFSLPVFFGVLSQAIAYRRAVRRLPPRPQAMNGEGLRARAPGSPRGRLMGGP